MPANLPNIIAICGNPKSGKSLTSKLLADEFGYSVQDDGRFLRDIAIANFGLTEEDVSTQEGKKRKITVNGQEMEVRELLGRIGNAFENEFGGNVIPEIALRRAQASGTGPFVFGSVRRDQGDFYKNVGGVVWEIDSPAPPSVYEFDTYEKKHVDFTLNNPGADAEDAINQLRSEIGRILAIS